MRQQATANLSTRQFATTTTTTTTAVSNSLDGIVLRRMRNSALQKWQQSHSDLTTTTLDESSQRGRSEQHPAQQQAPQTLERGENPNGALAVFCPLCFEDKQTSEICTLTICSHEFCMECMSKWTEASSTNHYANPSCPLCRLPITSEEVTAFMGDRCDSAAVEQEEDMILTGHGYLPLTVSPRVSGELSTTTSDSEPFTFMGWSS